jgi:hypothetical protein
MSRKATRVSRSGKRVIDRAVARGRSKRRHDFNVWGQKGRGGA